MLRIHRLIVWKAAWNNKLLLGIQQSLLLIV